MTDKLKEALIQKAEELGWGVTLEESGGWEFSKYSPAGEDFSAYVCGDDIVRELHEYYMDFDPDDHAAMWIEGRGTRGIPDSIRTLIDDAEAIDQMLKELAEALVDVEQETDDEEDEE